MISLDVNGKKYEIETNPDTPLLWVLRDQLGLTGTKYGCGVAQCGACTVHIDGKAQKSCRMPVKDAQGRKITTIEGIAEDHPVIKAWISGSVPQCGYCQPGQVMTAIALLNEKPHPGDDDIDDAMSGTLCRCGTYHRIRRAIHKASATTFTSVKTERVRVETEKPKRRKKRKKKSRKNKPKGEQQ